MERIKEKKKKKKGRSIGSDRREKENNYFKKKSGTAPTSLVRDVTLHALMSPLQLQVVFLFR